MFEVPSFWKAGALKANVNFRIPSVKEGLQLIILASFKMYLYASLEVPTVPVADDTVVSFVQRITTLNLSLFLEFVTERGCELSQLEVVVWNNWLIPVPPLALMSTG